MLAGKVRAELSEEKVEVDEVFRRSRDVPILTVSRAVVDFEAARLEKYSSGLVLPAARVIEGVLANDRAREPEIIEADDKLFDVNERWCCKRSSTMAGSSRREFIEVHSTSSSS